MERNIPKDPSKNSELILYQTEDGKSRLEVRFEGDTVWLHTTPNGRVVPNLGP